MIVVLLFFFVALAIGTMIIGHKTDSECAWTISILSWIFAFIVFVVGIVMVVDISKSRTIDQQIELYETENSQIEERISSIVSNYMEYEQTTFSQIKNQDSMELVTLFPELKSDSLVQEQINLYTANKTKILDLKSAKIDISRYRWILYFGS